jgi:hypothetical protein
MELAAHQRGALVVLDVADVVLLRQGDVRGEALLAEVAHRELVRVRQKVVDLRHAHVVVLQVVHHVRAVALHLKGKEVVEAMTISISYIVIFIILILFSLILKMNFNLTFII